MCGMFSRIKNCFVSDKNHSYNPSETVRKLSVVETSDRRESFRPLTPEEQDHEVERTTTDADGHESDDGE